VQVSQPVKQTPLQLLLSAVQNVPTGQVPQVLLEVFRAKLSLQTVQVVLLVQVWQFAEQFPEHVVVSLVCQNLPAGQAWQAFEVVLRIKLLLQSVQVVLLVQVWQFAGQFPEQLFAPLDNANFPDSHAAQSALTILKLVEVQVAQTLVFV